MQGGPGSIRSRVELNARYSLGYRREYPRPGSKLRVVRIKNLIRLSRFTELYSFFAWSKPIHLRVELMTLCRSAIETRRFRHAGVRVVAALGAVVLGAALWGSVRLASADLLFSRGTRESLERGIGLAPDSSRHHARLAVLLDAEGDRAGATAALENAVAASPRDSASWIALGLRREVSGDFTSAERCLLQAARVDRTYDPRWTLANFYFRRDDHDGFWPWARRAAEMAHGDMRPLFRLCWNRAADPALILSRAIPERPEVLRQYLVFLLQQGSLEPAASLAAKIGGQAQPDDVPVLLDACDRLLESGDAAGTLAVWNALCMHSLVAGAALSPLQGRSLTNGAFRNVPSSRGLDWRLPPVEGVSISRAAASPFLRAAFSGRQPERCEVLWQYLPLLPAARYRFDFEYRTSGVQAGTGLRWRVTSVGEGAGRPLADSFELSSESWAKGAVSFETPPDFRLARVVLVYQRAPGTTRIEGAVWLRNAALGFEP